MPIKPILFIAPLPAPQGGIATWTKKIMTTGLPDATPLRLVDTRIRGKRNVFQPASLNVAEITRTLRIIFLVLYQLLCHRPRLMHLCCALSPAGIMRDWLCAAFAKTLKIPVITHYHGNMQDFDGNSRNNLGNKVLRSLYGM